MAVNFNLYVGGLFKILLEFMSIVSLKLRTFFGTEKSNGKQALNLDFVTLFTYTCTTVSALGKVCLVNVSTYIISLYLLYFSAVYKCLLWKSVRVFQVRQRISQVQTKN